MRRAGIETLRRGARLTQRILFGGQALTVRDETGNWVPHDERYLALHWKKK